MEKEISIEIKDFEDKYMVSNHGYIVNIINGRKLKNTLCYKGYVRIGLINDKGKQVKKYLHQLLAVAFIPNPLKKKYVNHINGIKHDNRIENLEWCTAKENINHAYSIGLMTRNEVCKSDAVGMKNGSSILTDLDVLEIRSSKLSRKHLQLKYDVSKSTIAHIITRKKWKHL